MSTWEAPSFILFTVCTVDCTIAYINAETTMRIEGIIWLSTIVQKLARKHKVEIEEVEEVLANSARFRFVQRGDRWEEDVYMALGQTDAGRYLAVLFIYKKTQEALILSARDMSPKERRLYGKK